MSHAARPPLPLRSPARTARHLRQLLWGLLAGMGVVAVAVVGLRLGTLHAEMLDHAAQRVTDGTRLLGEDLRGLLRTTQFVAADAAAETGERHEGRTVPSAAQMAALRSALPDHGELAVYDAHGDLVAGSAGTAALPASVIDRPYFQAHRQGTQTIITPLPPSGADHLALIVSRRITGPDGAFAGVVVAIIETDNFADLLAGLDLGPRAVIAIYRTDGHVMFRLPSTGKSAAAAARILRATAVAPRGVLRAVSPVDGVERLTAYHALPDIGMVVACGIAIDHTLAPWRHDAGLAILGLAALTLLFGLPAVMAFRNLDREQALLDELEDKVRERTEEAERQAEQARRANQGKTRFLATASHDLRQPLQAAGMFAEVLSARLADTPHQTLVDKLRQSIEATNTLLSTLLDISTLEAGKIRPNLVAFPLMPTLASLADQMEPEATARGLRLDVVPTSAWVVSDRVLLERLLRNLLINALRYTAAGGVAVGCRRRGAAVAIQVVDSGIGIPADKLDAIFEDFTRLDATRGGPQRGPGLGLGVVRRTAALLGHTVSVRSAVGRGSTFTVTLPAALPPPAPVAAEDRLTAE